MSYRYKPAPGSLHAKLVAEAKVQPYVAPKGNLVRLWCER